MASGFRYAFVALVLAACVQAESNDPIKFQRRVDEARNRVWLLMHDGVVVYGASAPQRMMRVALPGWMYAGPRYGCLPDLALGPKGEALVTSDVLPVLWRVDPETLAVTRHELALDKDTDKDVGFTGLAWVPEESAYFAVSAIDGAFWRIDPELRSARKMMGRLGRLERGCAASAARRRAGAG